MLDTGVKLAGIALTVLIGISLITGPGIAGIVWLVQLDSDVEQLQGDVEQLNANMQEVLHLLRTLADDTEELRRDFADHTHRGDGKVQVRNCSDWPESASGP